MRTLTAAGLFAILVSFGAAGQLQSARQASRAAAPHAAEQSAEAKAKAAEKTARDTALRLAHVRVPSPPGTAGLRLDVNPSGPNAFAVDDVVTCRFHVEPASGTSRKFDCELGDGEIIRIKYGANNPELQGEVAATRLLSAFGFPADSMFVVAGVRCFGCPADPFPLLQRCWHDGEVERACLGPLDYTRPRDFTPAIVERKYPGEKIETSRSDGWSWDELASIDAAAGGAPRADVDALRLMAVFLAHWDNKARNQRLVCLDEAWDELAPCRRPLAMIADAGATFGPPKADLEGWSAAPIWRDRASCTATMRSLPYGGSTFHDTRITESGRRRAAQLLGSLSDDQIRQLFAGARFTNVDGWVRAFIERRRVITDGPSC
ncbi:MAG: hypothetical protein AB7Q29_04200 [Vicinamibacterales bacterium]